MKKLFMASARKNVCLTALFVTAVLTVLLWKIDTALAGTGGRGSVYLQLSFTEDNFNAILASWRSGGVDMMRSAAWLYFLYPVSCAALFSSAVAFFTRLRRGEGEPAAADLVFFSLPLAGGAAGVAAQFLLCLIFRGGAVTGPLILAESAAAAISWALFVASMALVLRGYFLFRKGMRQPGRQGPLRS